jgi:hypothetical protein
LLYQLTQVSTNKYESLFYMKHLHPLQSLYLFQPGNKIPVHDARGGRVEILLKDGEGVLGPNHVTQLITGIPELAAATTTTIAATTSIATTAPTAISAGSPAAAVSAATSSAVTAVPAATTSAIAAGPPASAAATKDFKTIRY